SRRWSTGCALWTGGIRGNQFACVSKDCLLEKALYMGGSPVHFFGEAVGRPLYTAKSEEFRSKIAEPSADCSVMAEPWKQTVPPHIFQALLLHKVTAFHGAIPRQQKGGSYAYEQATLEQARMAGRNQVDRPSHDRHALGPPGHGAGPAHHPHWHC